MKFSTSILISGFAALAQAQSACNSLTSAVPTCGTSCINSAGSAVGCAITDYACQCTSSNYAAIQSAAEPCVLSACGASAGSVLIAANAICSCVATAASGSSGTTTSSGPVSTSSSAAPGSTSSSSPSATATTSSSSSSAPTTTSSPTPNSTTGSLPSSATTSSPSAVTTGGGSMLEPWITVELAILAIFGGFMVIL